MKGQKGFTLIELVMVIVILGILAAVAVPKFQDISTNAKRAAEFGVAGGVAAGVQSLYAANLLNTAPTIAGGYDATSKFPSKLDGGTAGLSSPGAWGTAGVVPSGTSRRPRRDRPATAGSGLRFASPAPGWSRAGRVRNGWGPSRASGRARSVAVYPTGSLAACRHTAW